MRENWTIGAQLSTSHSSPGALDVDSVSEAVERARRVIDLDLLIIGSREAPEIFQSVLAPRRLASETFLWYNVLSDIDEMEESDLVVNWRGERSLGWGGWAEKGAQVDETFRFVCPNNPAPRRKTIRRLSELLCRYAFTGVFLDKIRFPSPANGLDEVLSCFCDHCRRAAEAVDLDLDAVVKVIEKRAMNPDATALPRNDGGASPWLEVLAAANPLLLRFLRFRADSIAAVVSEAHEVARSLGRKVSLDLFSPCLAQLVGQDYRLLARHCAWAKPMTYRVAQGPAGLRLEIPALVEGVARFFNIHESHIVDWAVRNVDAFDHDTLRRTRESAVPLPLIKAEIEVAIRAMQSVPAYFGLELVSHPGIVDITPALVRDMVNAGRAAHARGLVISWDLVHAPQDGIRALAEAL